MKTVDIKAIELDDILICLNCHYVDVAQTWIDEDAVHLSGECVKCKSKAFRLFQDFQSPRNPIQPVIPQKSNTIPIP